MRWILCGKNDAAVASLELLVDKGDDVLAVPIASDEGVDGWQRSLLAGAHRLGVPVEQPHRVNDPEIRARLARFGADALISIQYDQILRGPLLREVGCPCLNFHFALLPRHRGLSPIAFAVLCGDDEAGVTLHHMVEDIDAGDVIAQRAVPIGPADTARRVYDGVTEAAASLFRDSYPFDEQLLATRIEQDESEASYHRAGDFDFASRAVKWDQPAKSLQLWLRAMIFPPFQYPETSLGGRSLRIEAVGPTVGGPTSSPPSTVTAASRDGIDVAAADGAVRITALASAAGSGDGTLGSIAVGDRFDRGGDTG